MTTKQQIREKITKVLQEGILTQVLPFTSSDNPPITITAENYQTIVSSGLTEVGTANEGEQIIIYEQDFQTAENEFNRFVDDIADCYKNEDGTYETFNTQFGSGISYSFVGGVQVPLADAKITQDITAVGSFGCEASNLQLEDALIAITQFQSLNLTSTEINPTQAQEILDTTIFELITQQTTKQERINQFFQDYSILRSSNVPSDNNNDGIVDDNYDNENDISSENPDGSIVRLNENAGVENQNQTLEWLRDDLNRYFLDNVTDEELPIYEERSSGYLKFREMNQAIIIRNTENQQVIPDTWTTTGFTITMWVKFKDKVSGGTLFNYGNPTSTTQPAFGFKLETYVLNGNEDRKDGGSYIGSTWAELATNEGLNYFDNNEQARFLRLVVKESTPHNNEAGEPILHLRDSHIGVNDSLFKKHDIARANSQTLSKRFLSTTNVPIDFNEWYFIVATYNPDNDETITNDNKGEPLYWTGNLIITEDGSTTPTHDSGKGNKCKVEIISKTDLLRARGYQI